MIFALFQFLLVSFSSDTPNFATFRDFSFQPDGKIVVGGIVWTGRYSEVLLARLDSQGKMDPSFGYNGVVYPQLGDRDTQLDNIVSLPSGEILTVGRQFNGTNYELMLVRTLGSGVLDSSFAGQGKIVFPSQNRKDYFPKAVSVLSDGKFYVGGYVYDGKKNSVFLARFLKTGELDNNFGSGGWSLLSVGGMNDRSFAMQVQKDNKVILVGDSVYQSKRYFLALRVLPDGSLDSTFGADGKRLTFFKEGERFEASHVEVQPDGKILVGGTSYFKEGESRLAFVRYLPNGQLDSQFAFGGKLVTRILGGLESVSKVWVKDGKFGALASVHSRTQRSGLARWEQNGGLDSSFGSLGKVTLGIGAIKDYPTGLLMSKDGKILVGLTADNGISKEMYVARFLENGRLDESFGEFGKTKIEKKKEERVIASVPHEEKKEELPSLSVYPRLSFFQFQFEGVYLLQPPYGSLYTGEVVFAPEYYFSRVFSIRLHGAGMLLKSRENAYSPAATFGGVLALRPLGGLYLEAGGGYQTWFTLGSGMPALLGTLGWRFEENRFPDRLFIAYTHFLDTPTTYQFKVGLGFRI